MVVVGGDSGGTRLSDVRFLALDSSRPRQESWRKISDLNVARWGRPSVGVVGGRVTGLYLLLGSPHLHLTFLFIL